MTSAFNSPVETAVRVLAVLVESYPRALDRGQLVMLDHIVLNTADLGGPPSLHPALPARVGQLATKLTAIQQGLRVLLKADLIELHATDEGVEYLAGEASQYFLDLLVSTYARKLASRTQWTVEQFGGMTTAQMRAQLRMFFDEWVEEFDLEESARNTP